MKVKKKILHFIAVCGIISFITIPSIIVNLAPDPQVNALSEEEHSIEPLIDFVPEETSPIFTFTNEPSGRVGELFSLTFVSTKEVEEVSIYLPKEASIIKESLAEGITVVESTEENYWVIRSSESRGSFTLTLVFEEEGAYEITVGDSKVFIEIESLEESPEINGPKEDPNNETTEKIQTEIESGTQFNNSEIKLDNPLFSYSQNDPFINGWSMYVAPGILGQTREISISSTLDSSSEFRYTLDNNTDTDQVLFRKKSDSEGLRVKLKENTTIIVSQQIKTEIGKEYLVQGDFSGNARTSMLVYEGERISGPGGVGSSMGLNELRESTFIAESSLYTITARLSTLIGELHEESAIEYIQVGEKITINVEYVDENGDKLHENTEYYGIKGDEYEIEKIDIPGYILQNAGDYKGVLNNNKTVTFNYVTEKKSIVDPIDLETEVNPDNKPIIPENQGLLSIDFVSQFNFGSQNISAQSKAYYAQPQLLLNEDGTVNEQEKRPNYVQISDRRSEDARNGWQLSVTQNSQFSTESSRELSGARIQLTNQQLATNQEEVAPSLQKMEPLELVPGSKQVLLMTQGNEGKGTWIYRFGDADTAGSSVVLDVPKESNPEATNYSSTFSWELSVVPGN